MPSLDFNIFKGGIGGLGTFATVLLIFFLAILILGLIAVGIFLWLNNKKYKHIIPLYKKVGNQTIRVATFKAKDFKIGTAGDKLWFVRKAKKYIPIGTIQTAPNEYTHFERDDGEWINIGLPDIDEDLKKMNVKYINQDMRATRIAISEILEQRFKEKKSFWDKYGDRILTVILFLTVAIAMVVIFYQWSGIIEKTAELISRIETLQNTKSGTGNQGVVPAIVLLFGGLKKRWNFLKH